MEPLAAGDKCSYVCHKGHELVPTLYHFPSSCEACTKPLWNVFKPPPALECRRCHIKCHKDHMDRKEDVIAPCKGEAPPSHTAEGGPPGGLHLQLSLVCPPPPHTVNYDVSSARNLLLLASSQQEQQRWVGRLVKKIPKKPPPAEGLPRSSPRTSAKVQASQSTRRPSRQLPAGKSR